MLTTVAAPSPECLCIEFFLLPRPAPSSTINILSSYQFPDGPRRPESRHPFRRVCMNVRLRIYSVAGQRWYGATKDGAYTCQLYAQTAGYRASN